MYSVGEDLPEEEMVQIEIQNLMARINLPMARVEVRTDDGGHPIETDIANLTLKHLLLIRFYADPDFARAFRYDREDIARARRNEELAAQHGLRAEIENPLTGKPVGIRDFLSWTIQELKPLAQALNLWADLEPLVAMSKGAANTAEQIRFRLRAELGDSDVVPLEVLRMMAEERQALIRKDGKHR
jgi:gamma-glutamyl:cysteine ligase YbdK (ATP-grasp superfamily)